MRTKLLVMGKDLYSYGRKLESGLQRLPLFCKNETNLRYIRHYIQHMKNNDSSEATRFKHLGVLRWLSLNVRKDFTEMTREDLANLIDKIDFNSTNATDSKKFARYSKKLVLRKFFEYLCLFYGSCNNLRWLKVSMPKPRKKDKSEIFTIEEIKAMVQVCLDRNNLKEACFVAVCFETGGRPGEILNCRKENILRDEKGIRIFVSGAKGSRPIRLNNDVGAIDLLNEWLPQNCDEYVFPLTYYYARKRLKMIAERAKVTKKVYQYLFRHARITYLYPKVRPKVLKKFTGHSDGSRVMEETYAHLCDEDVDDAILALSPTVCQIQKEEPIEDLTVHEEVYQELMIQNA